MNCVLALCLLTATPPEAVKVAADWAEQNDASEIWFAWFPQESPHEKAALTFTLNHISKSSNDAFVGELPRVGFFFDLHDLADTEGDLKAVRYQFLLMARDDRRFHEPAIRADFPGYGVVTFSPPHRLLGPQGERLQRLATPTIPILDGRRLIAASLSSIKIQGVEPRYYGFRNLRPGQTTLEGYLRPRGGSLELVRDLLSLEQALVRVSNVTGKERAILAWRGQGVRPSAGTGLISLTMDLFDESADDPSKSFSRNLLIETADGYEMIAEMPNGWHEFTLWDGNQRLVAEAPPNLASDHTVPDKHTARLAPGISCIRCHANNEGWKEFDDWFPESPGFGVVGDSTNDFSADNIDTLQSRYGGDLSHAFQMARDSYAQRIFAVTRLEEPQQAARFTSQVYKEYIYDSVTEADVFAETGAESWDDFDPIPDPIVEALRQNEPVGRAEMEEVWEVLLASKK